MAIRRKTQLIMNVQHSLGVESVRSNLNTHAVLSEPTLTPEFGSIERILASPYSTRAQLAEAFKSGTCNFEMELQGPANGVPSATPRWHIPLRCSGMRGEQTHRATFVPSTGEPNTDVAHGSHFLMTTGAGSATEVDGWCIGRILANDPVGYFWFNPFNGNAMTNGAGTFDFDAEGNAISVSFNIQSRTNSWSYWPQTTPLAYVDVTSGWTGDLVPNAGGTNGIKHGDLIEQEDLAISGTQALGRVELPFHLKKTSVATNVVREPGSVTDTSQYTPADPLPLYFQHFDGTDRFSATFGDTPDATVDLKNRTGSFEIDGGAVHFGHANSALTMRVNYDGPETGLSSAVGNPTWRLRNGDRGIIEFEFTGAGVDPSDQTPPAFQADGAQPPPIIGGTYLLGTYYNPRFSEISMALASEVGLREDPTQASGYIGAAATARAPTITLDPEMVQELQFAMLERGWDKGTFRALLEWGSGTADGNNFRLEAWQCQVDSLGIGERVGQTTYDASLALTGDGDDELIFHVW